MAEEYSDEINQNPSILVAPSEDVTIPHIVTGRPPLNIDWCWVPPGSFTMGSESYDDKKPVHTVELAGFWLARYPVTNAQYRHFVEAGGYYEIRWWTEDHWWWPEFYRQRQPKGWMDNKWSGENQPVVGVNWVEAVAFSRWATKATGEPIRLPTEAEWEKAARGTDGRTYPWGNHAPSDKLCNFDWNVGKTTPVGQYSPAGDGPYGNADLSGNVWEWTGSRGKPYKIEGGREDQAKYGEPQMRGGSFYDDQKTVRGAHRGCAVSVYDLMVHIGFRLAASIVSAT